MMATTEITNSNYGRIILIVRARGGSVKVAKQVGSTWVTVDVFAADGAYPMELGISPTRFTPVAGAEYEVSR